MARESFEDPEVAGIMNAHFINVKVDREERPDLDAVYQTVCQLVTRQGGWPLTVFLTPELRPFFVGTYFPPDDRYGRLGFRRVLTTLAAAWRERRDEVERVAEEWTSALRQVEEAQPPPGGAGDGLARRMPDAAAERAIDRAVARLVADFDREFGGLGDAPKFPQTEALRLMLAHGGEPRELALFALRAMARGGIHDQLGGGFHRYSVDRAWRVPHFEKMLYDNALLPLACLDAFRLTGDGSMADAARDTLDYLLREMRSPEGGFFASQDADSPPPDDPSGHPEEGAYFVWTPEEIRRAVPDDADLALARFGVTREGNFEGGRTVLSLAASEEELAERFGLAREEVVRRLGRIRAALLSARERRPRPARDEKVLAGWNGLAISAFSQAASALGETRYRAAAASCAEFVLTRMRDAEGNLLRRFRAGRAGIAATLEDHAYLCAGLLDLHEATLELRWLAEAVRLARRMTELFWDEPSGSFFLALAGRSDLVQRPRALTDAGAPSPQSVALAALLRLLPFTGEERWREMAGAVLSRNLALFRRQPWGLASLGPVLRLHAMGPLEVTIVAPGGGADSDGDDAAEWAARVRRRFLPDLVLTMVTPEDARRWAPALTGRSEALPPIWEGRLGEDRAPAGEGDAARRPRPVAYVCRNFTCSLPLRTWDELHAQLTG